MSVKGNPALGPQSTRTALYDDENHVPVPTEVPLPKNLGALERRVHARVNGRRPVGEIARQLGLSVTEVAAVLARLREVGKLLGTNSDDGVDVSLVLDDE